MVLMGVMSSEGQKRGGNAAFKGGITGQTTPLENTKSSITDNSPILLRPVAAGEHSWPEDAFIYNGHHFYNFQNPKTWKEARRDCMEMGGHLAILDNNIPTKKMLMSKQCNGWVGYSKFFAKLGLTPFTVSAFDEAVSTRKVNKPLMRPYYDSDPRAGGFRAEPDLDSYGTPNVQGYICEWDR